MIFEDISQNSGNKATKESQIQKNLINFKRKKTQIIASFQYIFNGFCRLNRHRKQSGFWHFSHHS